jgi:hypothetical protein
MVRYQKHYGIATDIACTACQRRATIAPLLASLLVYLLLPAAGHGQDISAAAPVVVVPAQATQVALRIHTTDLTLAATDDGASASGSSFYRLQNDLPTDEVVTLFFSAPTADGSAALPGDLAATAAGAPLALQPSEGGAQALVTVPASGRLDLRLTYSLDLGTNPATGIHFPASALNPWPGAKSLRVTVNVPPTIPQDSWLRVLPEGWRFGPAQSAEAVAIQWLYDGNLPTDPIVFEFANPALWLQISERRAATESSNAPADYVALGDSYSRLATEAENADVRNRFYGQALATYDSAVASGTASGASATDLASAYLGQARLYRLRTLSPSGSVSPEHARLLVESSLAALGGLAADSPQRVELQQWLNDGLNIVLTDARERRDWPTAMETLDQLAAAPGSALDPQTIELERKKILFEQSLQLLEEGQRDRAVEVSGAGIVSEGLQPPPESQSLFTSWLSTITVSSDGTQMQFTGLPSAGKEAEAAAAATALGDAWSEVASSVGGDASVTSPTADQPNPAVTLNVRLPSGVSGIGLTNVTPLRNDWALLRTVLSQVAPEIVTDDSFLRRTALLRLPLDLRAAGEQWREVANELNVQSEALDAQSSPSNRSDPAVLEAALRAKVQAANYRAEANTWRALARNTQVVALLEGPRGAPTDARAWQVSLSDPPQTLQYSGWGVNYGGVVALAIGAIVVILLVTLFLWSLLQA